MNTKKLRQKILDLAIRGKLVPQDPNDEPASVLLERIRAEKERLVKECKLKKNDLEETLISEDEKPFEIPESWEWVRIGSIFSMQAGKNVTAADIKAEKSEKFPYQCYGGNGIRGYVAKYNTTGCFPLVGRQGALCGNVNIAEGNFWATEHAVVTNGFGLTEILWQYYFLTALNLNKLATATAQPGLAVSNVIESLIPLPPLAEQKRIANEIERWFTLIDELESNEGDLLKAIDKAKSKILDLAIHGKLVPQDSNDEPAIELLKRINPKFEVCDMEECPFAIPDNWCWTIFSSVCELITGSTPSKAHSEYYGGEFPFYKPSDLDAGRHVTVPSEYLSDKGKEVSRIIPEKSTAICCIGSIGKCGYIEREGTTNQQINTAVPMRCLYSLYLYYYCNSKSFVDTLTEGSSAITISIVNKSKLGKMPISLPPLAEQKRIVAKIEELFAVLDSIKESLEA